MFSNKLTEDRYELLIENSFLDTAKPWDKNQNSK